MQVIAVERWTFWAGVLTMVVAFVVNATVGSIGDAASGVTYDPSFALYALGLALFLGSLALGGSRDSTVRKVSYKPSG